MTLKEIIGLSFEELLKLAQAVIEEDKKLLEELNRE